MLDRPASMFVPAEDFVVAYDEADLGQSERYTHVMTRSANQIKKLQVSGFYRDVELVSSNVEDNSITEKYNESLEILSKKYNWDLPVFEKKIFVKGQN